MSQINLPSGKRRIDLVSIRSNVYTFGDPTARATHQRYLGALGRIMLWLSALSLAGAVFGMWATGSFRLLIMMIVVILFFAVIALLDYRSNRIPGEAVVIDAARGIVILPDTHQISGEWRMEDLAVIVAPDEEASGAGHHYWVMLQGTLADREHDWRFQLPLYGPGDEPDMQAAANEIRRLGSWHA